MNFNPSIPIYLQIIDSIQQDIVTGRLARGERIDSVRSLSEKYSVNLNTVQRACTELERKGIINTQRGIGSFVTDDEGIIAQMKSELSNNMISEFIQGMQHIGFSQEEILSLVGKALKK